MARPLWQVNLIKKGFPTPRIARLTRLPFLGKLVRLALFHNDHIVYLPIDESVAQAPGVVLPSDVVRHFVKIAGYRWIMNECICRSTHHCQHYPVDYGCLFLGEATRQINPELGRSVSAEEALDYVDRCQQAGLVHLIGRNKLDSVWLDAKPADKLLTICNCCECCCLWKVLIPHAYKPIADSVQRIDGLKVTVNHDCQGCGSCADQCFVNAIDIKDQKAVISEQCRGCGRCVIQCPEQAIQLSIDTVDLMNTRLIESISRLVSV